MSKKTRIAYLVTHPIQYQAPLLKKIYQDTTIDLTVFFCSNYSVQAFVDEGFNQNIQWDVPLLEGYKYEFLPTLTKINRITFWAPINYGLARRLRDGEFDVLWLHGYARFFHWIAMFSAKLLGIKILLRDEATFISVKRGFFKRNIKKIIMRLLNRVIDGYLAIGTLNKQYYEFLGISKEKIFMMPYAVDNEYFQLEVNRARKNREKLRMELDLDPSRPVILYASKMISRKQADVLLEAYIQLSANGVSEPFPYLLFIGDGIMREYLESRSNQLGWESICFLGFVNQSLLPQYFDLCDVFVLPSVFEPWGLVVNEVMNAGKAIIVSDQVGCGKDLVKNDVNGFVFNATDIGELSLLLEKITNKPERLKEFGKNSINIISKWGFDEDLIGLKQAIKYLES